jgi:hypothetical protein
MAASILLLGLANLRWYADAIFTVSSGNREKIQLILYILSDKKYIKRIHSLILGAIIIDNIPVE